MDAVRELLTSQAVRARRRARPAMSQIPHRETINPFHLRLFVDDNDGVDFATAHLQLPSDLKGEETCEAVAREDARPGALVLMQHFYKRAHEFFQPGIEETSLLFAARSQSVGQGI